MTDSPGTTSPTFDRQRFERMMRRSSFYDRWFQSSIEGLENIPGGEGALLVTNHGQFGFDLVVVIRLIHQHTGRVLRSLGDRVVFATPLFRDFARDWGIIEGEPEATVRLLEEGELVLVYPGGAKEALSAPDDEYRLQWDKAKGFVRAALRAQVPIIPLASVGNEEMYVQVVSKERVGKSVFGRFVSRFVGEKYVMPLYMGLGVLPFPTELHYIVGEPIRPPYGPEAADDEDIVDEIHRQATEATQLLIYQGLDAREAARAKDAG